MSKIPEEIPPNEPDLSGNELQYVQEAVKSGWISAKGDFVKRFEDEFASWIGVRGGVTTNSGTTALHLALAALDVGSGDEVIVPDFTFAASAAAVTYTGAKPIFVDVHPEYWGIQPEKIENKITDQTKAIIPVHLYGHPCEMDPIMEIASEHDLYLIEDAAEAHGAEYKGRKVGNFGDIACFSFYANKIITTGEGGMCVSDDKDLLHKMAYLRSHAMKPEERYWHEKIGFSYGMTNLQAAVGVAQLERIEEFIQQKRENAKLYSRRLSSLKGLKTPVELPWAKNVYWRYSILLNNEGLDIGKDSLMQNLTKKGIHTRRLFYPLHKLPPYVKYDDGKFPVSNRISKKGLSLPSSVKLTGEEINRVTTGIKEVISQ